MTKDEALQMCLEYIETDAHERKYVRHVIKAALKAKDEPYAFEAFMYSNDRVKIDPVTGNVGIGTPQQEAKDEPVACGACNGSGYMVRDPDIGTDQKCFVCEGSGVFEDITPPQRKPLTDEEIEDAWASCEPDWDDKVNVLTLARAIEAAHGIKGEA